MLSVNYLDRFHEGYIGIKASDPKTAVLLRAGPVDCS